MTDETDASLRNWLERLRLGDPAARNELIRHSQHRLKLLTHQMLRRDFPRLGRWVETSDVFQNVLIRLDRAIQAIELAAPADLLRLGATQIRRELIDLCDHYFGPEGAAAHHQTPLGAGGPEVAAEPTSSSNDPHRLAEWQEMHEYMSTLPDAERMLFDLLYYQGLAQPLASELLAIPLRTLKRRWQEARLRFMERFSDLVPF
jgi:RNA polymerase sigma factor (sigma-70 family)